MRSSDGSICEHCVLRLSMQDYVMCQSASRPLLVRAQHLQRWIII